MKFIIKNAPLHEIRRVPYSDISFDTDVIRIQRTSNNDLIFFEDFDNLSSKELTKVILEYDLDPDKIGVVIDEVRVLDNPHILSKTKKVLNPSKIFIRPVDTTRSTKMIEEGINHFINDNDWSLFDNYLTEEFDNTKRLMGQIGENIASSAKKGASQEWKNVKQEFKDDMVSFGKKAVVFAGGLYAVNRALDHMTRKYAVSDARKPQVMRSKLIADLRILRGKLPYYESEITRTYDNKRRSLLGKIIHKIKSAISYILNKLRFSRSRNDMNVNYQ